jgi:hypothetical protein
VLARAPALPGERLSPKERAPVDPVRRERSRGRRALVYATHTHRRDVTPLLRAVLEAAGLRGAVLKADTVAAERREEWVGARVREGLDVLVTNPRLVQTGLDLLDSPSVVWAEVDYSVYVLRQASRRNWRIGQRLPVEVTFLTYAGTLQAEALALVAAKTRASLAVESELPEEGLAALGEDGGDAYLAPARRLAESGDGASGHAHSLGALFADARRSADEADELLVGGDREDEPEAPREPIQSPVRPTPAGSETLDDPPLFATTGAEPAPVSHTTNGKIVTLEELARTHRRRKPQPKAAPGAQLAVFASETERAGSSWGRPSPRSA